MAKSCRGCKRDIASDQKTCYLCGSPQGFVHFYLKTSIAFLIVLLVFTASSQWYITKQLESEALDVAQLQQDQNQQTIQAVERVSQQLETAKQQIILLDDDLANASQLNTEQQQKLDDSASQIEAANKKASETEKRAGWLAKVNRNLKAEVAALKQQISSSATAATAATTETNLPVESLIEPAILEESESSQVSDGDGT